MQERPKTFSAEGVPAGEPEPICAVVTLEAYLAVVHLTAVGEHAARHLTNKEARVPVNTTPLLQTASWNFANALLQETQQCTDWKERKNVV